MQILMILDLCLKNGNVWGGLQALGKCFSRVELELIVEALHTHHTSFDEQYGAAIDQRAPFLLAFSAEGACILTGDNTGNIQQALQM